MEGNTFERFTSKSFCNFSHSIRNSIILCPRFNKSNSSFTSQPCSHQYICFSPTNNFLLTLFFRNNNCICENSRKSINMCSQ